MFVCLNINLLYISLIFKMLFVAKNFVAKNFAINEIWNLYYCLLLLFLSFCNPLFKERVFYVVTIFTDNKTAFQ